MTVTRPPAVNQDPAGRRRRPKPSAVDLMNAAQGLVFACAAFLATIEGLIRVFVS